MSLKEKRAEGGDFYNVLSFHSHQLPQPIASSRNKRIEHHLSAGRALPHSLSAGADVKCAWCLAQLGAVTEGAAVCFKCQAVHCSEGGTFGEELENRCWQIILVILFISISLFGWVSLFQLSTFVLPHHSNKSLVNHVMKKHIGFHMSPGIHKKDLGTINCATV